MISFSTCNSLIDLETQINGHRKNGKVIISIIPMRFREVNMNTFSEDKPKEYQAISWTIYMMDDLLPGW